MHRTCGIGFLGILGRPTQDGPKRCPVGYRRRSPTASHGIPHPEVANDCYGTRALAGVFLTGGFTPRHKPRRADAAIGYT